METFEMIYGVSPSIEQEGLNTWDKEDGCEWFFHNFFSTFKTFGNNFITFITNKYLISKNCNQKSDPILKSRDENVYDFQKKSKMEENIEKLNDLIQVL